jgi:uncharacterized membrane protein (UPF0127 family)
MKIMIKPANRGTLSAKYLGLMFVRNPLPTYFETRWGVHTFFVRKRIAVYILDEHNIVKIRKAVKPWRLFFWNPKYKKVLELPADDTRIKSIQLQSKIDFS